MKRLPSRGLGRATPNWLLAIGYWLLAIGYRLLGIGYSRSADAALEDLFLVQP
jgi:hypothetical protein